MMRLGRYIAQAGIASRRKAETLITSGLISVNGKVEKNCALSIDEEKDVVSYNGAAIGAEHKVYYILNKPEGYACSLRDSHNLKLVTDLVPAKPRVYPVGRLDKDSSGLVLLTNDGDLTFRMTHPSHTIPKVYEVLLDRPITHALIASLMKGVILTEGMARADAVKRLSSTKLRITIHQGWNRQIRRMLGECGYGVTSLTRISEGLLTLGSLKSGEHRQIFKKDIVV